LFSGTENANVNILTEDLLRASKALHGTTCTIKFLGKSISLSDCAGRRIHVNIVDREYRPEPISGHPTATPEKPSILADMDRGFLKEETYGILLKDNRAFCINKKGTFIVNIKALSEHPEDYTMIPKDFVRAYSSLDSISQTLSNDTRVFAESRNAVLEIPRLDTSRENQMISLLERCESLAGTSISYIDIDPDEVTRELSSIFLLAGKEQSVDVSVNNKLTIKSGQKFSSSIYSTINGIKEAEFGISPDFLRRALALIKCSRIELFPDGPMIALVRDKDSYCIIGLEKSSKGRREILT